MSRLLVLALTLAGCKVPITDVDARFIVSDAAWFAEEQTLFIFYEVQAEQGLGDESVLEIRYTTDDGDTDWVALADLPQVHTHLPMDCGRTSQCGSGSLHVPKEPRDFAVRLRYHRDGELALRARPVFNVVGPGPAYSHRSLLIYGVFAGGNRGVQWRARHRFPTIRNEEATRLGLRRRFLVQDRHAGATTPPIDANPYGYGTRCSGTLTALPWTELDTDERAIFEPEDLPDDLGASSGVCAQTTVFDPTGPFTTRAIARKNPEVRPAFPVLRSPVRDAVPIKYLLSVCERTISTRHVAMQRQRLQLGDAQPICIDDWEDTNLEDQLVARFREDIDATRAQGRDMVLAIAVHHDTPRIGFEIEQALARVVEVERDRNTPRLAGAFVLDSFAWEIREDSVIQTTLWCPARLPTEGEDQPENFSNASIACAVPPPELPTSLGLGPFDVGLLPILPTRSRYLQFIDTFSEAQAGRVVDLSFRAPERPATADHVVVPPFGVATFFNDEVISASAGDAFSFCESDEYVGFVFRTAVDPQPIPIQALPELHAALRLGNYELGIVWDFPFLLTIEYEAVAAVNVSAFSVSLPLGLGIPREDALGGELWSAEEYSLTQSLTQCRRHCGHPTFDSGGVYQVGALFDKAYLNACYAPVFPERGDPGFPLDP